MATCKKCGQQVVIGEVYHRECIEAELEQLKKEKAALLAAVRKLDYTCEYCAHDDDVEEGCDGYCTGCGSVKCYCRDCFNRSNWEWRGVKEGE